jgi:tetratricopeptide (TPR) repeat protein
MKAIPFVLVLVLVTGMVFSSTCSHGQKVDNARPMFGEFPKSDEYQKIDDDFRRSVLKQFKTIDSAVFVQIDNAWRYFYHNDLKTAMKRFNQAWLLNPEFADSYFGFAALLDMQDNRSEAERFYKMALSKDTGKDRAKICYRRIADCKEQLRDFPGTIEAYTKLSEVDPTNSFAFKKIGFFQMQSDNRDKAVTAYEKAIALDPTDPMTYNNRGYLYQREKKYKEAIADYSKAIELDSKYISAYANRAITSMEMNDNSTAKKDLETCVQLDPNDPGLRRILGISKLKLNDKVGACNDFKQSKQLGDTQADALIAQACK